MDACQKHHIMRASTLRSMRNVWPQGRPHHSSCPTQADREHFTQLLFEQFNIAGLYLGEQGILSLYSAGKITGTVIDLGHGKTGMSSPLPPQPAISSTRLCVCTGWSSNVCFSQPVGIAVDDKRVSTQSTT